MIAATLPRVFTGVSLRSTQNPIPLRKHIKAGLAFDVRGSAGRRPLGRCDLWSHWRGVPGEGLLWPLGLCLPEAWVTGSGWAGDGAQALGVCPDPVLLWSRLSARVSHFLQGPWGARRLVVPGQGQAASSQRPHSRLWGVGLGLGTTHKQKQKANGKWAEPRPEPRRGPVPSRPACARCTCRQPEACCSGPSSAPCSPSLRPTFIHGRASPGPWDSGPAQPEVTTGGCPVAQPQGSPWRRGASGQLCVRKCRSGRPSVPSRSQAPQPDVASSSLCISWWHCGPG